MVNEYSINSSEMEFLKYSLDNVLILGNKGNVPRQNGFFENGGTMEEYTHFKTAAEKEYEKTQQGYENLKAQVINEIQSKNNYDALSDENKEILNTNINEFIDLVGKLCKVYVAFEYERVPKSKIGNILITERFKANHIQSLIKNYILSYVANYNGIVAHNGNVEQEITDMMDKIIKTVKKTTEDSDFYQEGIDKALKELFVNVSEKTSDIYANIEARQNFDYEASKGNVK